jgi:signal transduction histidine kinase
VVKTRRRLLEIALLAAIYVGAARLGLRMDAVSGFATLVWPPTGIALAALVVLGPGLWPGVMIGAFVANVWSGAPAPVAGGIAIGNTLEAVIGASALRRLGFRPPLARVRDVSLLIALAAVLSTAVSATIGSACLVLGGVAAPSRFGVTWRAWWIGDLIGALVVAPVLLTWGTIDPSPPAGSRRAFEAAALALAAALVGALVFCARPVPGLAAIQQPYLIFPVLIWASIRFGPRGAASTTFLVSAIAVLGTALERGPFAHGTLSESLVFLQVFMALVAVTFLILGAVTAERRQASWARRELLAIASHDLKNPLHAIQLGLALMRRKGSEAGVRKEIDAIDRSAAHMDRLVRDLLDLEAIEGSHLRLDRQPHAVRDLVAEAVEVLRPLAAQKSIDLRAETAADLRVLCDRARVLQVLSNLIGNAVKFTPAGGSITVSAGPFERDRVRISVVDTGCGMSRAELGRIFERNWQADPSARQGSGLGLFIAKGLVEAHASRIWAESEPGAGTRLHFTLPAAS